MFLAAMFVLPMFLSLLAAPIYHVMNANIGSMWKHLVYSLIFLSPLAGRGCSLIVWQFHLRQRRGANYYSIVGATITIIGLAWFVDHSLDQNWWIQRSWPNATSVIEYMKSQKLSREDRVLADGAQIYEYYFDFGLDDRDIWHNTWYLEYERLQGPDAMVAAITNREFDFVVLDGYHNPSVTQDLETALATAGYELGYEESQELGSGATICLRVYLVPERQILDNWLGEEASCPDGYTED
jgi:hypothetical protein